MKWKSVNSIANFSIILRSLPSLSLSTRHLTQYHKKLLKFFTHSRFTHVSLQETNTNQRLLYKENAYDHADAEKYMQQNSNLIILICLHILRTTKLTEILSDLNQAVPYHLADDNQVNWSNAYNWMRFLELSPLEENAKAPDFPIFLYQARQVNLTCLCKIVMHEQRMYYPGQKNRYSWDIHEIDRQCIMRYHVTSTSICNLSSRRADTASRVDVESKLDLARYHMIEQQINLMNFSAVTIFLARVVFHTV